MENDIYTLKDALMGGPGLDGYAYQADVFCIDCGRSIIHDVFKSYPDGVDWLTFQDSESIPQPIFFGESPDYPQHCGDCGEYLYGEDPEEDL